GAQARRPHGPQPGDRRADPDQGQQEGRLPGREGIEGSGLVRRPAIVFDGRRRTDLCIRPLFVFLISRSPHCPYWQPLTSEVISGPDCGAIFAILGDAHSSPVILGCSIISSSALANATRTIARWRCCSIALNGVSPRAVVMPVIGVLRRDRDMTDVSGL